MSSAVSYALAATGSSAVSEPIKNDAKPVSHVESKAAGKAENETQPTKEPTKESKSEAKSQGKSPSPSSDPKDSSKDSSKDSKTEPEESRRNSLQPAPVPEVNVWKVKPPVTTPAVSLDAEHWPSPEESGSVAKKDKDSKPKPVVRSGKEKWVPYTPVISSSTASSQQQHQSQQQKPNKKKNNANGNANHKNHYNKNDKDNKDKKNGPNGSGGKFNKQKQAGTNSNANANANGSNGTAYANGGKKKDSKEASPADSKSVNGSVSANASNVTNGNAANGFKSPQNKERKFQENGKPNQNHSQDHLNQNQSQNQSQYQHQNSQNFQNNQYNRRYYKNNGQQQNFNLGGQNQVMMTGPNYYMQPDLIYSQQQQMFAAAAAAAVAAAASANPLAPPSQYEVTIGLIIAQVEYYMSVENLLKDIYMRRNMNSQGLIPLSVLASFNRVVALTNGDMDLLIEACRWSPSIELIGSKIRPRNNWSTWVLAESERTPNGLDEDAGPDLLAAYLQQAQAQTQGQGQVQVPAAPPASASAPAAPIENHASTPKFNAAAAVPFVPKNESSS